MQNQDLGVIRFAEKLLEILEEGSFTSSYKCAVLIALMDLCFEENSRSRTAPQGVSTRQLAEKIIEIYWPHAAIYPGTSAVLSQNSKGQAKILSSILEFRRDYAPEISSSPEREARLKPQLYEELVRSVEWTLIEMPLPKLQRIGISKDQFIYEIGWNDHMPKRAVSLYQRGRVSTFDNMIRFKPYVGEYLIQLNHLLRPRIYRKWTSLVAQFNGLPDSELEDFLFGRERISTAPVRAPLWEIQDERCYYCETRINEPTEAEVDHFLPWSRYPDDGIENLVVADKRCNGYKKDFLAAIPHVEKWRRRFKSDLSEGSQLKQVAESANWDSHPDKTLSAARAIYLRVPDNARLWHRHREFMQTNTFEMADLF